MGNSLRVLLLSALPPPSGGVATWTRQLLENVEAEDVEFSFVNTSLEGRRTFTATQLSFREMWRNAKIIVSFVGKLIASRPRLIHLNCSLSPVGIFRDRLMTCIGRVFQVPVIVHYRGNVPDFDNSFCGGLSGWALESMAKRAASNIVLNQASKSWFEKKGMEAGRIRILPNFIPDSRVPVETARGGGPNGRFRVLYVGTVTKLKGCDLIVRVAGMLPEIDFVLVGAVDEDFKTNMGFLLRNLLLTGELEPKCVCDEFSSANAFIFPSPSEGFPNAVLEAMAAGLPVVATRVGSIPEMISDFEGGYLVEVGDERGFVNAIRNLAADAALGRHMGERNQEHVRKEYVFSVVFPQLRKLYVEILKSKRIVGDRANA